MYNNFYTKEDKGLVHVFTGNGKGKTTAALGFAFRAISHGLKVLVVQFLKGSEYSGEMMTQEQLPELEIRQFGRGCPYAQLLQNGSRNCGNCRLCFMPHQEQDIKQAQNAFTEAKDAIMSNQYDMVVMDEVNVAVSMGLISSDDVLDLINLNNYGTEIVLTGRNAPFDIMDKADKVTMMHEVKHPMHRGVMGRRGIEY